MSARLIPLIGLGLITGCASLGPDYQRPDVPLINQWESTQQNAVPPLGWQEVFADANLQRLISTALENNRDLRVAALNVQAFEAQFKIQRAALLPQLNLGVSSNRQRVPQSISATGNDYISSTVSATIGIPSYEVDLFGRVNSLKEQALQTWLAQVQNQRSAHLSLVSAVVNAYLTWVADQQQLALAEENLGIEQDNADLVQLRFDEGVASSLEQAQAIGSLQSIRVTVAQYQRLVEQSRHALTQLLGSPLPEGFQTAASLDAINVPQVDAGAPSSLLEQRPDLLAAEFQLRAANANIGAAKAALFPSIRLTGSFGNASSDLDRLFDANTRTWSFAPQINLPIFTAGALRSQVDVAEINKKIAVAEYEGAVQTAFTEVADALSASAGYQEQLARQYDALAAYQDYFDKAELRYRAGIDSMLTRLDAQRSLLSSQQAVINARLALLQSRVNLFKALGGGWYTESQPEGVASTATLR